MADLVKTQVFKICNFENSHSLRLCQNICMQTLFQNPVYLDLKEDIEEKSQDARLGVITDASTDSWQEPRAPVTISASLEDLEQQILQRVAVLLNTAKERTFNGLADESTLQQEIAAAKMYQDIHQRLQAKAKLKARQSTLSTKGIPPHFFCGRLL